LAAPTRLTAATSSPAPARHRYLNAAELLQLVREHQPPSTANQASLDIFDKPNDTGTPAKLVKDQQMYGALVAGRLSNIVLPATPTQEVKFYFGDRNLEDLWIAVRWSS
jgi:hypothetical protein